MQSITRPYAWKDDEAKPAALRPGTSLPAPRPLRTLKPTERCDANPLGASRIPVRSGRWSFARGLPSPAPERSEGRPPGALRFPRGGEPQSLAGPPGRVASLFPAPPVRVSGAAPVIPPPRPLAGLPRRPAGFRPRCPRPTPERCGAYRATRPLSRARS